MRKSTGISLLLLIFLSISLLTFSLLSLSSAQTDKTLGQKSADRTVEYYAADSQANRILAQIDQQLADLLLLAEADPNPEETFLSSISSIPPSLSAVSWTESSAENQLSFTVPVKEGQVLQAELLICYPKEAQDSMYRIQTWKILNTDVWTADTNQHLYRLTEEG